MNEPSLIRQRKKKQGNEGSISKTIEHKVGGKVVSSSEITEKFKGAKLLNPAYVGIGGSVTKSPAPYESVKVSVSISLPCEPDEKNIRLTFDRASLLVDEFIGIELDNALGTTGGKA